MNTAVSQVFQYADKAGELLRVLANPHRLSMLCLIKESELSVGQLAERLGVRNSVVSQHLAVLRRSGIVQTRREKQTVLCSIKDRKTYGVIAALQEIYCTTMEPPLEVNKTSLIKGNSKLCSKKPSIRSARGSYD